MAVGGLGSGGIRGPSPFECDSSLRDSSVSKTALIVLGFRMAEPQVSRERSSARFRNEGSNLESTGVAKRGEMKRAIPRLQIVLQARRPRLAIYDDMSFFSSPRLLLILKIIQFANHPLEALQPN